MSERLDHLLLITLSKNVQDLCSRAFLKDLETSFRIPLYQVFEIPFDADLNSLG